MSDTIAPQVPTEVQNTGLEYGRKMAIAAHLLPMATAIIPFANTVGPFAIWYTQKDKDAFATSHAKAAFNFQATVTLVSITFSLLTLISLKMPYMAGIFSLSSLLTGMVFLPFIMIGVIATLTIAVIRAYEGKYFKYPLSYDFASIVEKKFFKA